MGEAPTLPASVLATLYARPCNGVPLEDLLRHVCTTAVGFLDGADEASVTVCANGRAETLGATARLAIDADEEQYREGGGPCLDAATGNQLVLVPDLASDDRWPAARRMAAVGARSSLSLPLPVQDESIGALNIYARRPEVFDATSAALGAEFASHAAVAVANAVSYSTAAEQARQLRQAMESRAVIEQAKGILIATTGCSPEEAFHLLVQQSQHENRKLREIAAELVAMKTSVA